MYLFVCQSVCWTVKIVYNKFKEIAIAIIIIIINIILIIFIITHSAALTIVVVGVIFIILVVYLLLVVVVVVTAIYFSVHIFATKQRAVRNMRSALHQLSWLLGSRLQCPPVPLMELARCLSYKASL